MGEEGQEDIPQVTAGDTGEAQGQPETAFGQNAADQEQETGNPTNEGKISRPKNRGLTCPKRIQLSTRVKSDAFSLLPTRNCQENRDFCRNPGGWEFPPGA